MVTFEGQKQDLDPEVRMRILIGAKVLNIFLNMKS
jgi:hypothetical protein